MTTTTEASIRTSSAYMTVAWRDDARIRVTHTSASAPEPFVVNFEAPDYSTPLTLYLSEGQARSLLSGLGRAIAAATRGESA